MQNPKTSKPKSPRKPRAKKTLVDKIAEAVEEGQVGVTDQGNPPESEEGKKIVISSEFDALAESARGGLEHFRNIVQDLSMKQLKRSLIAVVEHPLEQTIEIPENGPEAEVINLGQMINYSKFRMSLEMMKKENQAKLKKEENENASESISEGASNE